jgi:hypothetical protein
MSTTNIVYEGKKLNVSYVVDSEYHHGLYATSITHDGVEIDVNWLNEPTVLGIESLVAKAIEKENIEGFGSLHTFNRVMTGFDTAIQELEAA